jgi:hypothetical protein
LDDCNREVRAAPRSQTFSAPISRKVGSWDSLSASFPESLVEFPYQDQAAVGSDAGTLEINLVRGVEGELKG